MPCKLNHYCIDGLRYQCPASTPVTQWTGTDSLDGCLTCVQRNGNTANPIYDDLVGDCVSCYEYDSSTPIWDGNACVACASGTSFNGETGLCETQAPSLTCDANNVCTLTKALNTCEVGYIAIQSAEDLAKIGVDSNYPVSSNYCLVNDISLEEFADKEWEGSYYSWSADKNISGIMLIGWRAIPAFSGVFDGNNRQINDLFANLQSPAGWYVGLFESIEATGIVRNLVLNNVNLEYQTMIKEYAVGAIAADNKGLISNVGVNGSVEVYAGGGGSSSCGGITSTNSGTIEKSYFHGIVGGNTVHGGSHGGITSTNTGSINNSYAIITDSSLLFTGGGIAAGGTGTISNCYAVVPGPLTEGSIFYGIVSDYYNATVSSSYYLENTSLKGACYSSCDASSKSLAEMQTPQTFINAGWDTTIWSLVQGQYPKLKGVGGQD